MSAVEKVQQHPAFVQAQNKANYYFKQLDKELSKYPVLNTFEQHTQLPKTFVALGAVLLIALFHFINPLAAPVSNLIGWALPAYLSLTALERPAPQDDVQWLTYWVLLGGLGVAESIASGVILYYLPWYYALKSVFVLWLQLPSLRGAHFVYVNALKPVLSSVLGHCGAVAHTDTVTAEGLRDRVHTATAD